MPTRLTRMGKSGLEATEDSDHQDNIFARLHLILSFFASINHNQTMRHRSCPILTFSRSHGGNGGQCAPTLVAIGTGTADRSGILDPAFPLSPGPPGGEMR